MAGSRQTGATARQVVVTDPVEMAKEAADKSQRDAGEVENLEDLSVLPQPPSVAEFLPGSSALV